MRAKNKLSSLKQRLRGNLKHITLNWIILQSPRNQIEIVQYLQVAMHFKQCTYLEVRHTMRAETRVEVSFDSKCMLNVVVQSRESRWASEWKRRLEWAIREGLAKCFLHSDVDVLHWANKYESNIGGEMKKQVFQPLMTLVFAVCFASSFWRWKSYRGYYVCLLMR